MDGQFTPKAVFSSLLKWLVIPAIIAFIIINGIQNILPASNAWAEHPERVGLVLLAVVFCTVFAADRIKAIRESRKGRK